MEQPQGKSSAHSVLLRTRPDLPDLIHLLSFQPLPSPVCGFQVVFPGEPCVSCGWALCAYRNIIYIIYHSQCIPLPFTKGAWIFICIRGARAIFTYLICLCGNICRLPIPEQTEFFNTSMSLLQLVPWLRKTLCPFTSPPMDLRLVTKSIFSCENPSSV